MALSFLVAPLAGAWIEIRFYEHIQSLKIVAPLAGAWIEIDFRALRDVIVASRSPRGSVD